MSEIKMKTKNPMKSKALISVGVLAILNALFLLIPMGIDLINMIKNGTHHMGFVNTIFWLPYLMGMLLSFIMLLLVSIGGFARLNVLCAIGAVGYSVVFTVSMIFNRINCNLSVNDSVRVRGYFTTLGILLKNDLRPVYIFKFYNYPALFFLTFGIFLVSVIYIMRTAKASGKAMKIIAIIIAVLSVMIMAFSGLPYTISRFLYEGRAYGVMTANRIFYYHSRAFQEMFHSTMLNPRRFMIIDNIITAIRIFMDFILFAVMGLIGGITIPSKKITKKQKEQAVESQGSEN